MSDFDKFAAELIASGAKVAAGSRAVVQKGALNVKNDWQEALGDSPSFKGVKGTPTFDTKVSADGIEAEIGPRTAGRQPGDLVSIAHFGGARGGGGVADPQTFLDAEAPKFEAAMNALIDKALP